MARPGGGCCLVTVATATRVSFELGCLPGCEERSGDLFDLMSSGKYDVCAVMEIPESMEDWRLEHRTARKRVWRAERRGYEADVLHREFHADDIHAINTSKAHRQGRPMAHTYMQRQEFSPLPAYPCDRHAYRISGVFYDNVAVAYLVMIRAGDLALVSQILGHADHEDNGVMFQLFAFALEREIAAGPGVVVYNRWDSGEPGLRDFKARLGFTESAVEWVA